MYYYNRITHIVLIHTIFLASALITKCSEKKEFHFPQSILNKEEEKSPLTAKELNKLFEKINRPREKTPPKEHIFHNYEYVNLPNPNANKLGTEKTKVYVRETTYDPNMPGFTNYYQKPEPIEKQSSNIPKNIAPYFNFSAINTRENYQKEASKLAQGEDTPVCIQCNYCNHIENNFFCVATYNIITHRKKEHSICGCNNPHPTPQAAFDCTLCQQKY